MCVCVAAEASAGESTGAEGSAASSQPLPGERRLGVSAALRQRWEQQRLQRRRPHFGDTATAQAYEEQANAALESGGSSAGAVIGTGRVIAQEMVVNAMLSELSAQLDQAADAANLNSAIS
eukprot:COSAG05_NODE_1617_length_4393_cov_5.095249_1_plen_121_part_00